MREGLHPAVLPEATQQDIPQRRKAIQMWTVREAVSGRSTLPGKHTRKTHTTSLYFSVKNKVQNPASNLAAKGKRNTFLPQIWLSLNSMFGALHSSPCRSGMPAVQMPAKEHSQLEKVFLDL